MPEITPYMGLVVPDAPGTNPNEAFDWNEFLRKNFKKTDTMKVIGGTAIFNARAYTDNVTSILNWDGLLNDALNIEFDNIDEQTAVARGIVVLFPSGTYKLTTKNLNTLTIQPAALSLVGFGRSIITCEGYPELAQIVSLNDVQNVMITGLTFVGAGEENPSTVVTKGIQISNGKNVVIRDCKFRYLATAIHFTNNGSSECENLWVQNNDIRNYQRDAIIGTRAQNAYITDNIIHRYSTEIAFPGTVEDGHAINWITGLGSVSNTPHKYLVIKGNEILYPRRNAIYLQRQTGMNRLPVMVDISGNNIVNPGIHQDYGQELDVHLRGSAIWSQHTGLTRITNNYIYDWSGFAIYLKDISTANANNIRPNITNNTIYTEFSFDAHLPSNALNSASGIYVEYCNYANISNNTVEYKAINTAFSIERAAIQVQSSNYVNVCGNVVRGRGIFKNMKKSAFVGNYFRDSSGAGDCITFTDNPAGDNHSVYSGNYATGYFFGMDFNNIRPKTVVGNAATIQYSELTSDNEPTTKIIGNTDATTLAAPNGTGVIIDSEAYCINHTGLHTRGKYIHREMFGFHNTKSSHPLSTVNIGGQECIRLNAHTDGASEGAWIYGGGIKQARSNEDRFKVEVRIENTTSNSAQLRYDLIVKIGGTTILSKTNELANIPAAGSTLVFDIRAEDIVGDTPGVERLLNVAFRRTSIATPDTLENVFALKHIGVNQMARYDANL